MLRCRLISDIHHEFRNELYPLKPIVKKSEDDQTILILAGDIGRPFDKSYAQFLRLSKSMYDHVLVVAGNHEYYSYTFEQVNEQIGRVCDATGCVFLNCSGIVIGGYRFLGCTFWSEIPNELRTKCRHGLNDFYQIKNFTPQIFNRLHCTQKAWLKQEIEDSGREEPEFPVIVITHHGPSFKLVNPRYAGDVLNCCFVSESEELLKDQVKAWFCGHTHDVGKTVIKGVPVYLNCVGYPDEAHVHHDYDFLVEFPKRLDYF